MPPRYRRRFLEIPRPETPKTPVTRVVSLLSRGLWYTAGSGAVFLYIDVFHVPKQPSRFLTETVVQVLAYAIAAQVIAAIAAVTCLALWKK